MWIGPTMNILPFDRQIAVISALVEGMSIRSTERLTGVHRDTVMRLGVRIGHGCDRVHDALMRDLRPSTLELDELWAFVGKKQKRVLPDEEGKGDFYTFLALDGTDKEIISYRTGKRDMTTTLEFVYDLRARVVGAPVIFSDAFACYADAVAGAFGSRCHYGQIVKRYAGDPPVDAARRYSPAAVVAVDRRVMIGRPNPRAICTSHVERQNLNVRMASRRFTRLTNAFSKKAENHAAAVSLFVAHHNFCRPHEALRGITPAMAAGVTEQIWSIADLIEATTIDTSPSPPATPAATIR